MPAFMSYLEQNKSAKQGRGDGRKIWMVNGRGSREPSTPPELPRAET